MLIRGIDFFLVRKARNAVPTAQLSGVEHDDAILNAKKKDWISSNNIEIYQPTFLSLNNLKWA